jgi:hypothetical protein
MIAVEHFFALNNPAFVRAPDKNYFPLSVRRSLHEDLNVNGGFLLRALLLSENARRAFQQPALPIGDLVGIVIDGCVSSAGVFSPLIVASATLASNAGECARRLHFVSHTPVSQQESSPPSGRKSTWPTVRICGGKVSSLSRH